MFWFGSLIEAWPVLGSFMISIIQARNQSGNAVYLFVDVCMVVFAFLPLQRGIPAVSPDVLNQFPAAPVPTLTGFPMPLPATVSQQPLMPSTPPVSMPLSIGPGVMGMSITAPAGGAAGQPSGGFVPSYPPSQVSLLLVHGRSPLSWKENYPGSFEAMYRQQTLSKRQKMELKSGTWHLNTWSHATKDVLLFFPASSWWH